MIKILEKYFGQEKTLFFQSSDALTAISGDTYLKYKQGWKIEIWFGCNDGEVCIHASNDPEKIEQIIKAIIY